MSNFFDSEIVQEEIDNIEKLQQKIVQEIFSGIYFKSIEERKSHLDSLEELLEKQKILYFRLKLSDDPEAKDTIERMKEGALLSGFKKTNSLEEVFDMMKKSIKNMKELLDK